MPLSKVIPGVSEYLWMAGRFEYAFWQLDSTFLPPFRSSYSANVSVLVLLFEAISTGPGIGIVGILPKSDHFFADWSMFNTAYTYSAYLRFKNTPFSLGYQFLYSELHPYPAFKIHTHSIYLLCDFGFFSKKK
jgi:hypothetical protein